jgi:hypothetical protein
LGNLKRGAGTSLSSESIASGAAGRPGKEDKSYGLGMIGVVAGSLGVAVAAHYSGLLSIIPFANIAMTFGLVCFVGIVLQLARQHYSRSGEASTAPYPVPHLPSGRTRRSLFTLVVLDKIVGVFIPLPCDTFASRCLSSVGSSLTWGTAWLSAVSPDLQ